MRRPCRTPSGSRGSRTRRDSGRPASSAGGTIYIWTFGRNKTAHLIAREFGRDDVFRLLMEHSPEGLKLSLACELGDEELFRTMLAQRPDLVRTMSDDDRRKVADAAQSNNTNAVRLMLEAGWPAEARGTHRATALHWASFHGNAEMVRQILEHHPPVDAKGDEFNLTPLGWAVYGSLHGWHRNTGDYAGTVEALLRAGAEPPPLTDDLEASSAVLEVLRRRVNRS